MHAFIIAPLFFLLLPLTNAQNATVNATIAGLAAQTPPCVIPCGGAAIVTVGCSFTDYLCQCQHSAQLNQLVPPCLAANSTCSAADITKFQTISVQICAVLGINLTIPTNLPTSGGASATMTGTAVTSVMTMTATGNSSTSAPAAATSKAGAMILDVNKLVVGGFVGAGLLGFFL